MGDSVEYLTFERWNSKKFLLLLGCSVKKQDIEALAQGEIPLAGIMTTASDPQQIAQYKEWIATALNIPVHSASQFSDRRNKQEISLLRLMETEDTPEIDFYFGEDLTAPKLPKFKTDRLQRALLGNATLWIIGFDAANPSDELVGRPLLTVLLPRGPGTVFFWGMEDSPENKAFKRYAEKHNQGFFKETLAEALHLAEADQFSGEDVEDEDSSFVSEKTSDFFYRGGVPIPIDSVELSRYSSTAVLLTWNLLNRNLPCGKFEQQRKFQDFLVKSCNEGPQWYGYSEKSPFYVVRSDTDDLLKERVEDRFNKFTGHGQTDQSNVIAVSGPAGSGKSVTLANLCYKVFMEKEHPVVFIPKQTAFFSDTSDSFQQLNELLHLIEIKFSKKKNCTLLVWDCSSFHEGPQFAKELCDNLKNQGRNDFILVYSTYENQEKDHPKKNFLCLSRKFSSQTEKQNFYDKVARYSGLTKEELRHLQLDTENINDIFTWFYQVLFYMQDALKKSFFREKNAVSSYIMQTQQRILNIQKSIEQETVNGLMLSKLKSAGILEAYGIQDPCQVAMSDGNNTGDPTLFFDSFSFFVALFTFLDVPLGDGLADILMSGDFSSPLNEISFDYTNTRQIYRSTLTEEIPWIIYQEAPTWIEEGHFVFRSSAEAEIFLLQYNEAEIVDRVCWLLDVCKIAHQKFGFIPGRDLAYLLRMFGPNASNLPLRSQSKINWRAIHDHYEEIIRCLSEWNEVDLDTPEKDYTILRLVYAREYYGNILEPALDKPTSDENEKEKRNTYEKQLDNLIKCIYDAQNEADQLKSMAETEDDPHLWLPLNNIRVELLFSQLKCADILESYHKDFPPQNSSANQKDKYTKDFCKYKASYSEAFLWMQNAIARDPENGYFYIALFRIFRMEFDNFANLDEKMRRSQEIQQYVEQAISSGESMIHRGSNGKDELKKECLKVQRLIDKTFLNFDVSISAVLEDRLSEATRKVYQQLIKTNNPAGIHFVVHQELSRAHIDLFQCYSLTQEQIKVCSQALEFIEGQGEGSPILEEFYIRFIMFRLKWAVWNGIPLNNQTDRQPTHFTQTQWDELYFDCRHLREIAEQNHIVPSPLFILAYALSELQAKGTYSKEAERLLNSLRFMRGKRMISPYLVTDETGKAYSYIGTVKKPPEDNSPNGKMEIKLPSGRLIANFNRRYIDFHGKMQAENTILPNLALGISHAGFQTYSLSKLPRCNGTGGGRL